MIVEFSEKKQLKFSIPKDIRDVKLQYFCNNFIKADECFTETNTIIINQISAYINSVANIDIFIDLDETSLEHLENSIVKYKF